MTAPLTLTEPSPFILLHELATLTPMIVRKSAIERVDAARSRRGLEALVLIQGAAPIRVVEQADDIACELGAYFDRCRVCRAPTPGAGKIGDLCADCLAEIEAAS